MSNIVRVDREHAASKGQDAMRKQSNKGLAKTCPLSPTWFDDYFWPRVWAEPMSGCWLWGGTLDRDNYARAHKSKENISASHMSYEYFKGPIPLVLCSTISAVFHHA